MSSPLTAGNSWDGGDIAPNCALRLTLPEGKALRQTAREAYSRDVFSSHSVIDGDFRPPSQAPNQTARDATSPARTPGNS